MQRASGLPPALGVSPASPEPPRPRKMSNAKIAGIVVLCVVLVIAGVFARAALLYNEVVSSSEPPQASLVADPWQQGNLTLHITRVTGGYTQSVDRIRFALADRNESPLYNGLAGHNDFSGAPSVNITIAYDDADGTGHGVMSVGDSIHLRVEPSTTNPLVGGWFTMFPGGGYQIARMQLP